MNIQQTIIKGIREQLFFNDYLVLPEFGGFVLKSNGSHFSGGGLSLLPPSKTVSFNVQLKQNDGILVNWLQSRLNCNSAEALGHIRDFSLYCSGILKAKRRLNIDGIGFFYLDFENNICFEPQQDANFLSSSFGLAPVSLPATHTQEKSPRKEVTFINRPVVEETPGEKRRPVRLRLRNIANYAFAGFVIVSLLVLLVVNSKINGELKASMVSWSVNGLYSPVAYEPLDIAKTEPDPKVYVADANGIAMVDVSGSKKIAVKAVVGLSEKNLGRVESSNYQVVLGCFSMLHNAERMVKRLNSNNVKAVISSRNAKGMYVVSVGSYSTKTEAISRLADVRDQFPKAWVKQPE